MLNTYEYLDAAAILRLKTLAEKSEPLRAALVNTPENISMLCDRIMAAMQAKEMDALRELAHELKGLAVTIGAWRLQIQVNSLLAPDAKIDDSVVQRLRDVRDRTIAEFILLLN